MIARRGLAPPSETMQIGRSVNLQKRRSVNRRSLPRRLARGALPLILWVALAGGIGTAVAGATGYLKGRAAGVEAAENKASAERADAERQHRAQMDKLRADAQAAADAAGREAADRYHQIDIARSEAQRALSTEQALTRRLRGERDAALRDRDRVRDAALAAAATGGTAEADDTVGACRARADALGRAMGEVLRDYRACSLDLEDASGSTRAFLRWSGAVEASQRTGEVATP